MIANLKRCKKYNSKERQYAAVLLFLLKFDSIGLPVAASLLINIVQLSEAERWQTLENKVAE